MTTPGKPGGGSRWGSFLSQAVAGVESRLDNMLTEGEEADRQRQIAYAKNLAAKQQQAAAAAADAQPPAAATPKPTATPTPTPTQTTQTTPAKPPASRANDRLQARLAKAMAAKNAQHGSGGGGASPRSSMDQQARSPSPASSSVRASMDRESRLSMDAAGAAAAVGAGVKGGSEKAESKPATPDPAADAPFAAPPAATGAAVVKEAPSTEAMPVFSKPSGGDAANGVLPHPESKPETKTEPKSETTPDVKTETKAEVAADIKSTTPEIKLEPPVETKEDEKKHVSTPVTVKEPVKEEVNKDETKKEIKEEPKPEPKKEPNTEAKTETPKVEEPTPTPPPTTPQQLPQSSNEELETIKARQQEEIQEYVERIDALQSKLQYLSKNAVDAAKKTKGAAAKGSLEQKLAEKDERIALLMGEGQRLSTTEGKFRTTIRKLRAQMADLEKQVDELKKGKEKSDAELDAMRSSANSNEEQEKRNEEVRRVSAALEKQIDALKKDVAAKDEAYRRLEHDAKVRAEQAEFASAEALNKALATEREKQKDYEGTIASLRAEKQAVADKARTDAAEWQEKVHAATERSRRLEEELKLELRASESKLEAMRVAAEEASSGIGGESQIKLIRQMETLQSQYASASDNWQGIEASLLAKVSGMEGERDEAQRRESEMRKKARDSASRCRRLEDELQDVSPALATARQELETSREELAAQRTRTRSAETALEQTKAELDKLQRSATFASEGERRQWAENQSRPESPRLSVPRTFSSDLVGLPLPGRTPRRSPTPGSNPDSGGPEGMFFGRRLSNQPPLRASTLSTLGTGGAMVPPPPLSPYEPPSESPRATSPPLPLLDDDAESSAPRNVAQDMISVSTVGAGPSVQLVERMSAAIRRLEAEKVAAKEEMVRVCGQRDEARSDMVGLMKDVEANKAAVERVTRLEADMEDMNRRYQTTLELLGEKSELVEELRADVQDVKAMYRDLVERTVK